MSYLYCLVTLVVLRSEDLIGSGLNLVDPRRPDAAALDFGDEGFRFLVQCSAQLDLYPDRRLPAAPG
jgi:hypothetical protein